MTYENTFCCICFQHDLKLIKCTRCAYFMCIDCLFKMSKMKLSLCNSECCKHECNIDEKKWICTKRPVILSYQCPTCTLPVNVNIENLNEYIKNRVRKYGELNVRTNKASNTGITYFGVLDLDKDSLQLHRLNRNDF